MSYMTPYYFTGSAGQDVNIWMRSYDFTPKMGLTLSGSTTLIPPSASSNAWQYDSPYSAAAIHLPISTSGVYKIEATSTGATDTGSFSLYVSQGKTASVYTNNVTTPWRLTYSPNGNRIFATEWVFTDVLTSNVTVINPQSNAIVYTYDYPNTCMFDGVYNSENDTVFVWVSSSTGEFLQEYSNDGASVISSHSISTDWVMAGDKSGLMTYNSGSNHIMLVPKNSTYGFPLSYSVFNCNTNAIVHTNLPPADIVCVTPTYAYSNDQYYMAPLGIGSAVVKVNGTTFSQSTTMAMSESVYAIYYVPEVDRLFGEGFNGDAMVYNPATDARVSVIPGIRDLLFAIYDPCRNCLVVSSDDQTGGFTGGGLCYVSTGSYLPLNFVLYEGIWSIVFCNDTSTVFAQNYNNDELISVFSQIPTGSLPQPDYPTPTTSSCTSCLVYTGSLHASGSPAYGIVDTTSRRLIVGGGTGGFLTFVNVDTLVVTNSISNSVFFDDTGITAADNNLGDRFFFFPDVNNQTNIEKYDVNGNFITSIGPVVNDVISNDTTVNLYSLVNIGGKIWVTHVTNSFFNRTSSVSVIDPTTNATLAGFNLMPGYNSLTLQCYSIEDSALGYSYLYVRDVQSYYQIEVYSASVSPLSMSYIGTIDMGFGGIPGGLTYVPDTGKVYIGAYGTASFNSEIWEINPLTLATDYVYDLSTIQNQNVYRLTYNQITKRLSTAGANPPTEICQFDPILRTFVCSSSVDSMGYGGGMVGVDNTKGNEYMVLPYASPLQFGTSGSIMVYNPTCSTDPLLAPTGLTLTSGSALRPGAAAVILNWTNSMTTPAFFIIQRSLDTSSYATIAGIGETTYTDDTASVGNTYWYRVAASDEHGISSYSNTASITFYNPLSAPELAITSGSIVLNWSSSDSPSSTIIERSTGGVFSQIHTASYGTTSYVDTNVTDSNTNVYHYRAFRSSSIGLANSNYSTTSSVVFSVARALWKNNFDSSSCQKFYIDSGSGFFGFTGSNGGAPCNVSRVEIYTTILNSGPSYYVTASIPWSNDGAFFWHGLPNNENNVFDKVNFTMSINGVISPRISTFGGQFGGFESGSTGISASWKNIVIGQMQSKSMNVISMSIECLSTPTAPYLSTFSSGAMTIRPLAHP